MTSEGGSAATGAAPDSEAAAIRTRLFGRRLREDDDDRLLASLSAAAAFSVATRFLPLVIMAGRRGKYGSGLERNEREESVSPRKKRALNNLKISVTRDVSGVRSTVSH